MMAEEKPSFRFGEFELQPAERRLLGAGRPISLTPKVFDTLVLLVERAGHVVSKDELMKALWPRGYVEESNLTKHVWLIRRALCDGEKDSRFIETVPKLGYRFVAPVERGLAPAVPAAAPLLPAPPPSPAAVPEALVAAAAAPPLEPLPLPPAARLGRSSGGYGLFAGAGLAWLAVLALAWRMIPGPAAPAHHGRSIALVGFSNLSRNAKDAWLAPALTEMLGTELNATDSLQVVPDEVVRGASTDIESPAAGGYAPQTLTRLRRRLDADYVVSGSYLVTGSAEDAPLRIDLAVQDSRSGVVLAAVSSQSGLSGLIGLVTRAGASLRAKLGAAPSSAAALDLVAHEQPPSLDVARRLGFALDALHHYDPARARDELLEAIAESPGYAPAYTYLAQAWTALGYQDKAVAAAEQAARNAARLPDEQRLQAEAVAQSSRAQWSEAAHTWEQLVHLKPLNPEYRLQAIDAQLAAGAVTGAQTTLRGLRQLPGSAADPRVELAAARIAGVQSDARGAAAHAELALHQAQQHDAAGLTADAQAALAAARVLLGANDAARDNLNAAIEAYRAIHNPRGEADARRELAQLLGNLNRGQEAREEYQRAMALEQSIGDLAGVARVYRALCSMLWLAGDRDGAQAAAQHALQLGRNTGDLGMQTWTLQALATIASDDAASDEVLGEFREVIALDQRAGNHTVWPLTNYADVQRMRGELSQARDTCQRARAEAATLTDPQFRVFSGFTCALIEADLGHGTAARGSLAEVIRQVGTGDPSYRYNSLMTLAQLDMDRAAWSQARTRLEQASSGFAAQEERTGEADALAMLALCAEALGDHAARDAAAQRARSLRASITSRQEVYVVDIALARLDGAARPGGDAAERLLALAADAEQRRWLGWSLEAKLAAFELLNASGTGAAATLRADIETTAKSHGYGRILDLLQRSAHERALARRS